MKPFTILIAEDDLLSRMILERSVVQWGHQMVSAVDGENALALLQNHSVDLCLLDWDMPKVTGPEICREVRNNATGPIPYLILLTARNHPQEIQLGYEAGADDYLTKPCDLKYLRRRINTVAEKVRRQEQWLQQANQAEEANAVGFSPLDMYLSDLRLARRKI